MEIYEFPGLSWELGTPKTAQGKPWESLAGGKKDTGILTIEDLGELLSVFCFINIAWIGPEDLGLSCLLQPKRDVLWQLSTNGHNHSYDLLVTCRFFSRFEKPYLMSSLAHRYP
jgi:hypothetical protein